MNEVIRAQAEELIKEAILAKTPGMDLRPGTPQYDIYVRPFLDVVASIVEKLDEAERKRTIANWGDLSEAEADVQAAKLYTERFAGSEAEGSVRVKLAVAKDVEVPAGTPVTVAGKDYVTTETVILAGTSLSLDPVLGTVDVDLPVVATEPGSDYSAIAGTEAVVASFEGDGDVLEVIVSSPIQGGTDKETNEELYERARRGMVARNLVNAPTIEVLLREQFGPTIQRLTVVGYQEPEMLRDLLSVIDQKLGPVTIHRGGFTDVYVQTPVFRKVVQFDLLPGAEFIDLSVYRAVLKIHGVKVKGDPEATPFYALVDVDAKLRYSAADPVRLFVDPALTGQTLEVDLSYAPDVVAIHNFCNGESQRLTNADVLVRFYHPVFLSGSIYVEGGAGLEEAASLAVGRYLSGLSGTDALVVSRITEAIQGAGVGQVFQDFEVSAEYVLGSGERVELNSSTSLILEPRHDQGFSPRVACFIGEAIIITAIS